MNGRDAHEYDEEQALQKAHRDWQFQRLVIFALEISITAIASGVQGTMMHDLCIHFLENARLFREGRYQDIQITKHIKL
jgi:hypothetical protein